MHVYSDLCGVLVLSISYSNIPFGFQMEIINWKGAVKMEGEKTQLSKVVLRKLRAVMIVMPVTVRLVMK